MKNITLLSVILLLIIQLQVILSIEPELIKLKRDYGHYRVAFGSCSKFYRNHDTKAFRQISKQVPDVFIWLGDVAYVDDMMTPGRFVMDHDEESVRKKYKLTKTDANYKTLRNTTKIIGVWDDHDFGLNNAGIDFPYKEQNQEIFLDFLDEPQNSERRQQKGVYQSYYLGQSEQVKIILTDGRYFRDEQSGDVLGEEQWKWLERELSEEGVELFLLGSGTQIITDDRPGQENWYPESKDRLYKLIKQNSARVLFLSGDIHMAELLKHPCSVEKAGYQLQEVTSSGLTVDFDHILPNVGEITKIGFSTIYSGVKDRYMKQNYGIIDIKLNKTDILESTLHVMIFGEKTIINPVKQRQYKLQDFEQWQNIHGEDSYNKQVVDEQKNCILNTVPDVNERIKNSYISQFQREVFQKQNWKLIGILAYILIFAAFVLHVFIWLFRIVFGLFKMPKQNQQQQQDDEQNSDGDESQPLIQNKKKSSESKKNK